MISYSHDGDYMTTCYSQGWSATIESEPIGNYDPSWEKILKAMNRIFARIFGKAIEELGLFRGEKDYKQPRQIERKLFSSKALRIYSTTTIASNNLCLNSSHIGKIAQKWLSVWLPALSANARAVND